MAYSHRFKLKLKISLFVFTAVHQLMFIKRFAPFYLICRPILCSNIFIPNYFVIRMPPFNLRPKPDLMTLSTRLRIKIPCRCCCVFEFSIERHINNDDGLAYINCPNCHEQHSFKACYPITEANIKIITAGVRIDLDPKEIFEIAREKDCDFLYHANTAITAGTFIEQVALLSRAQVENNGLEQTGQYTDALDIRWGIYNDIFMDLVDIHVWAKSNNNYGPVIFRFPLDLLKDYPFQSVRITKINPSDWTWKDTIEKRYYTSEDEFRQGYHRGNFGSMLIFSKINGRMPLEDTLEAFIVDKSDLAWSDTGIALDETLTTKIKHLKKGTPLAEVKVLRRRCTRGICGCFHSYENMAAPVITKLFRPK